MRTLEIRSISPDLLRGYLVAEFGGTRGDDGNVTGPAWHARFEVGAPVQMGQTRIPVLFVHFDGEDAEAAATFLARKAMRGGG